MWPPILNLLSQQRSWNPVERLLYPAPISSYDLGSFPKELICLSRDDGEKVPCLFLRFRHARFIVIYFHANAEDIGLSHVFCTAMKDAFQVNVLAVEYPGYGASSGYMSEEGIIANAETAMRFVLQELKWPIDSILIFGRSLGTHAALVLASRYAVGGLILVSPFTSIRELFRAQVGSLADYVEERFRNMDLANKITSSTLVIHGKKDTLVPLEHGNKIYDALLCRKMMVSPAWMSHNSSLFKEVNTLVLPMTQFFSLPDYSFDEVEVPDYVFPIVSRIEVEASQAEEDLTRGHGEGPAAGVPKWTIEQNPSAGPAMSFSEDPSNCVNICQRRLGSGQPQVARRYFDEDSGMAFNQDAVEVRVQSRLRPGLSV